MEKEYRDYYYCGGVVKERLVPREFRWKGKLIVFENVPIGVCAQCGEKVITPKVAKGNDHILEVNKNQQRLSKFQYINTKLVERFIKTWIQLTIANLSISFCLD